MKTGFIRSFDRVKGLFSGKKSVFPLCSGRPRKAVCGTFLKACVLTGCVILFTTFMAYAGKTAPKAVDGRSRLAAKAAAKKGLDWMLNYPGKFDNPTHPAVLSQINNKYCHSDRIDKFAKGVFSELASDPLYAAYARWFDESTPFRYADDFLLEYTSSNPQGYEDCFISAIYCDRQPIPPPIEAKIFNSEGTTGYQLTHHFMAMSFLEVYGCRDRVSDKKFGQVLDETAKKIAKEAAASGFDDLFVERVAFLEYAGYHDLVKPKWIKKIIRNQKPSGGWFDKKFDAYSENPHTTGLALLALVLYINECPEEPVPAGTDKLQNPSK